MIKVLVVDDSALVRQMLTTLLSTDPEIEVIGTAADPHIAREKIKALNPDVLTLDVEMPRMDGITFLSNLMRLRPMPVIMVSSLTERGAEVTLKALEYGAVDFVTKPKLDVAAGLQSYADEIITKIKVAAKAKVRAITNHHTKIVPSAVAPIGFKTTEKIIAIGASTGGTEAIREILEDLPADAPGILIAQHIPETFSSRFAARLDQCCSLRVREARDGDPVLPGHAFVAPGNQHLLLKRNGTRFFCQLSSADPVNRHRPSVDVLFHSVANTAGANALGVLLTGMGTDGAKGLLQMREAGAFTVAQDEATSLVWGMPGEAVKLGSVEAVLGLGQIAATLINHLRN